MVYPFAMKIWVARKILVHRVIVSLILAPCWARRPAIAVRRILMISPESSLHAHKVVYCLWGLECVDTFPLLLLQTPTGKASGFFPIVPQFIEKSIEHMLGGRPFFLSDITLLMGRCDLVHNEFRPCGDPDSLQSKDVLVGQSLVNVSFPRYFAIWGSNKFESVISS